MTKISESELDGGSICNHYSGRTVSYSARKADPQGASQRMQGVVSRVCRILEAELAPSIPVPVPIQIAVARGRILKP